MNYQRALVTITQFFGIAVLSLCGSVSFLNSGMYSGFEQSLTKTWPVSYLAWLICLAMLVLGGFFILIRNKGGGFLAVTAAILSLPSITSYNGIDLLKIFGGTSHVTTQLTFTQVMSVGCLIISAYFLLDLSGQVKRTEKHLKARGATLSDLAAVTQNQHLISIILAGSALLISLVILGISRGFEALISRTVLPLSWWIVPVALFCIFVLGIYLFWIATRKNA